MAATLSDLCMMKIAALDAIAREDFTTAGKLEDELRAAGRDDVADEVAAAWHRAPFMRSDLARGMDPVAGSAMLAQFAERAGV